MGFAVRDPRVCDGENVAQEVGGPSLVSIYNAVAAIDPDSVEKLLDLLGDDVDGLAHLLAAHRTCIDNLKLVDEAIAARLMPLIPFGGQTVTGIGTLEIKGGKKRTRYDQPRLVSALAARISDEIPEDAPRANVVEQTAKTIAEAAGATAPSFTGWRKGVVSKRGLDLDAYADEIEPSDKSLIIRAAS